MKEVRLKYLFPASFRTLMALISKFFYTFGKKEVKEEEVFEKMKDKLEISESTLRNYLNLSVKLHFLDVKDKRYSIREEGVKFDRRNTLEARIVVVLDRLDRSSSDSVNFIVDTLNPKPSILHPANGARLNNSSVLVNCKNYE